MVVEKLAYVTINNFYTCSSISSQSRAALLRAVSAFGVRIPNLGALPIIASVSLTHLPYLFACFYESVSCVYAFFSTCFSTCVARAACFEFGSVSITTFVFSFSFFYQFNRHLCHDAYSCTHKSANMPKLLPIYIFISLNPAYVYANMYKHFPPLPYSYTYIDILICIVCVMFYTYTHVFVYFLLFPKLNRHLCHGVY